MRNPEIFHYLQIVEDLDVRAASAWLDLELWLLGVKFLDELLDRVGRGIQPLPRIRPLELVFRVGE